MIELLLQAERSLTVGQLDAAERLYWQAIENDPRNSIAVVGLARVSLDRGDERTAYQFARKALEIDAENAAAQRLIARLGEVMQYRGEAPPTEPTPALARRPDLGPRPTPAPRPEGAGQRTAARPTNDVGGPTSAPDGPVGPTPSESVGPTSARPTKPPPQEGRRRGLVGRILGR